jgi:hypothetical protein
MPGFDQTGGNDPGDDPGDDPVEAALELARDVAPDLDAILLTLYPDAETLDIFRPGDAELETANAIARAVGQAMAEDGVEVLVQRADRGAFRRWLATREDTPDIRRSWVDRGRLLRGADALRALGLKPPPAPPTPRFPPAPGKTADSLLDAHDDPDSGEFAALAGAVIEAGRDDVLDLALRKLRAQRSEENAAELAAELLEIAQGAALGPSGWAELVALPVALAAPLPRAGSTGAVPDAMALAEGLIASGALAEEEELRLLPGWRSPEAAAALSPAAIRRVLLDLLAGREPRDLPPGDTDDLSRRGFALLVGLRLDWDIPIWDAIEAEGGLPEPPDEDEPTPEERGRAKAFDRWRAQVAAEHDGTVPLDLVPLSEAGAAIADFLDEAGAQVAGIEEIRDFVAMARREAAGEDVVCRPEIMGDALELTIYSEGGRFLDSLTLGPDRLPASPEAMLGLIGTFVRLVRDAPGR